MAFRTAFRRSAALARRASQAPTTRAVHMLAPVACAALRKSVPLAQTVVARRGVKQLTFGDTVETVIERSDYPREKLAQIFKGQTMAVLGYGLQGRAQALNMKDNGLKVIIGLEVNGFSWQAALDDGWVHGKDLFSLEEATEKGNIVMYLLSDAGQKEQWNLIKPGLTKGKALYFSHGFSVVFSDQTGVVPPADIDVIMCAPKGAGATVRSLFLDGAGINSSYAVYQDATGNAQERAKALGVAIGSGYLYETTFRKEVLSDLTGERGVLMGAIQGLFRAQYDVLREKGHTPSEAFNETVEEATQSLYPLVGANGMDWMYANCSTTARRGALDWFPKFYEATLPTFRELYESVESGEETRRTLEYNSRPDHRERLEAELKEIRDSEMWRAGKTVRELRPENQPTKK